MLTSEVLGMMPASNIGLPVLVATAERLISVPLGQSIDKRVASPVPMKVA